ncbi:wax ester/triacylglycerol synthase domain-containing protein [Streptosporangium lutulentum]
MAARSGRCISSRAWPSGRVALYAKVHHCAIDGVSGAETLAALLDLTPEPRVVEPPEPSPRPAPRTWSPCSPGP